MQVDTQDRRAPNPSNVATQHSLTFHLYFLPQLQHQQPLWWHPELEPHQRCCYGAADDAPLLEPLAEPHVVIGMEVAQNPSAVAANRST